MDGLRLHKYAGILAITLAILLVITTVGCTKSPTPTTATTKTSTTTTPAATFSNLEAFNKLVDAEWAKWNAPATLSGVTGPKGVPGKKVMGIAYAMAADAIKRQDGAARQAAQLLGWEYTTFDLRGNVTAANEAADQAIQSKVDGVIVMALDASALPAALEKLKQAGIPVVGINGENMKDLYSFTTFVEENIRQIGRAHAVASYKLSGGHLRAVYFIAPSVRYSMVNLGGFMDFVSQARTAGADAQVLDQADFPPTDSTRMSAAAVTLVQKNPSYNVFAAASDSYLDIAFGALSAAGLTTDPSKFAVGLNASAAAMSRVRKGEYEKATIGRPNEEGGWQAMDALNRIFVGQKPVAPMSQIRIITKAEAEKYPEGPYTGDVDLAATYKALWGK